MQRWMTSSMAYALMLALGLCSACAQPRTGPEIDVLLADAMEASDARLAQGDAVGAYKLARLVALVDPGYPGVKGHEAILPVELEELFSNPVMGSNVAQREPTDPDLYERLLWYLPDRVLDALDIISFDVHMGFGLFVDLHATRAAQLGLGFRTVGGVGWHDHRSLGIQTQVQASANVLAFGRESYDAYLVGTSEVRAGRWSVSELHAPTSELYQEYKDYWAIGAGVTALWVGADVDIHLLEIFDFAVGWFTFDPLNDDNATTQGTRFTPAEAELVSLLSQVVARDDETRAYKRWLEDNADERRQQLEAPALLEAEAAAAAQAARDADPTFPERDTDEEAPGPVPQPGDDP
jgi:hypothetical protein